MSFEYPWSLSFVSSSASLEKENNNSRIELRCYYRKPLFTNFNEAFESKIQWIFFFPRNQALSLEPSCGNYFKKDFLRAKREAEPPQVFWIFMSITLYSS